MKLVTELKGGWCDSEYQKTEIEKLSLNSEETVKKEEILAAFKKYRVSQVFENTMEPAGGFEPSTY